MGKELYGFKILVVDDDLDTRELIQWVLQRVGAEVTAVASSADALRALEAERFHVLISDISMPDEDGYTFLKKVRALGPERGGRIAAIALTAHSLVQDRLQSLRAGFQTHVPKPLVPEELVEVVASLVYMGRS